MPESSFYTITYVETAMPGKEVFHDQDIWCTRRQAEHNARKLSADPDVLVAFLTPGATYYDNPLVYVNGRKVGGPKGVT